MHISIVVHRPPLRPPTHISLHTGAAAAAVRHTRLVEGVVGRLLCVAVADSSERVRLEVLRALQAPGQGLDDYLAQVGICMWAPHTRKR